MKKVEKKITVFGTVISILGGLLAVFMGAYSLIYRVIANYPQEYGLIDVVFYCLMGTIFIAIGCILIIYTIKKDKKPGISA